MNQFDYKSFYDKAGTANGWDFSRIKCVAKGEKWDFLHEVSRRCKKSDLLLDIGTGGGEALLTIAESALLLVGIDLSNSMIQTANENLAKSSCSNVRFLQMDAGRLDFPESFFDIVSCRHSAFNAKEAANVLVEGGFFLTQQVSENDKFNLKEAFGRGQGSGSEDGALKNRCIAELYEAGFSDVQDFEYDAAVYYATYEDLVFLLKYTPIIPNFGESDEDFERLRMFIERNQTAEGIETNSKRFMLIARK